MPLIFVYGSLKRGYSASSFLAEQRFIAEAHTGPAYRMFDYGGFPGLVEDSDHGYIVEGEVWEIAPDCLSLLDQYEGLDEGLYIRSTAKLATPVDLDDPVLVYLYNRDVSSLLDVGSVWKREWDSGED